MYDGTVDVARSTATWCWSARATSASGCAERPTGRCTTRTSPRSTTATPTWVSPGPLNRRAIPSRRSTSWQREVREGRRDHPGERRRGRRRPPVHAVRRYPDGLISPIWVNENLIDIEVKAGAAGRPRRSSGAQRPRPTRSTTRATTVAANKPTTLKVTEPTPGAHRGDGPDRRRTARRCVVQGDRRPGRLRPHSLHRGAAASRRDRDRHHRPAPTRPRCCRPRTATSRRQSASTSRPTCRQYVKLIMKVSYNRGADLMTCLAAAGWEHRLRQAWPRRSRPPPASACPPTIVYPFDGAGSNDQSRTTPTALATFYAERPRPPTARRCSTRCPSSARTGRWPTS